MYKVPDLEVSVGGTPEWAYFFNHGLSGEKLTSIVKLMKVSALNGLWLLGGRIVPPLKSTVAATIISATQSYQLCPHLMDPSLMILS